jgi:hypothetical protein
MPGFGQRGHLKRTVRMAIMIGKRLLGFDNFMMMLE